MTLARRIAWRLAAALFTLLVASMLVFAISRLSPGDPIRSMHVQSGISEARIEAIRDSYGLNDSLPAQYFSWLGHVLAGDFGVSISQRIPVAELLLPAFANTLLLTASTVAFTVLVGTAIGLYSGVRGSGFWNRVVMIGAEIGNNIPVVWLGVLIIWVFSLKLQILPSSGMYDLRAGASFAGLLQHLILPTIAASATSLLVLARLTRDAVGSVVRADYTTTYLSLGYSWRDIVAASVLRNSASPVVSITGLQIGYLLGGVVIVENIFAWPGLGSQLTNAVTGNDYPVVQTGILLICVAFIAINLITDLIIDLLNPKIRAAA